MEPAGRRWPAWPRGLRATLWLCCLLPDWAGGTWTHAGLQYANRRSLLTAVDCHSLGCNKMWTDGQTPPPAFALPDGGQCQEEDGLKPDPKIASASVACVTRLLAGLCPGELLPPHARTPLAGTHLNWCSYTVTRMVSCHIQNGTYLQRVFQSCRWPMGCTGGSYRTIVRPTYKQAYKTVTALEWKCCPGHTGANCEAGCLNCSKLSELLERLNFLEAKVVTLSVASPVPNQQLPLKGDASADSSTLWGSLAAQGSPGDEATKGSPGPRERVRTSIPARDGTCLDCLMHYTQLCKGDRPCGDPQVPWGQRETPAFGGLRGFRVLRALQDRKETHFCPTPSLKWVSQDQLESLDFQDRSALQGPLESQAHRGVMVPLEGLVLTGQRAVLGRKEREDRKDFLAREV
ncbi:hypothetical protein lerEdw1_019447 [Lerista edwardsae]|nr:hypothetical protein lerEdw1_019447 [Lerista edwardsae]